MTPADLTLIEQYLNERYRLIPRRGPLIDVQGIITVVLHATADYYDIGITELLNSRANGNGSDRPITYMRGLAVKLARELTHGRATFSDLGFHIGERGTAMSQYYLNKFNARARKVATLTLDYRSVKAAAVRELGKFKPIKN